MAATIPPPIEVRLDELLRERGMTLTELSDRIGLTLANLSILKTGKAKAIRFTTLEAICRELDCQHFASSKFAPSLDVRIFTSPGAYAQSTLTPRATRRELSTPVHVTP